MLIRRDSLIQVCAALWLLFCPLVQSQTPPMQSGEPEVLARVTRSGGYAGGHEEFTIYDDGRVVRGDGAAYRIPLSVLQSIIEEMKEHHAPKSFRIQNPEGMCSDCFVYRITLRHPSGSKVFTLNELGIPGYERGSTLTKSLRDLVSRLR